MRKQAKNCGSSNRKLGWTAPPIVSDNKVYIGAFPSKIYLLNAYTGTLEALRERTIHIQGIEYGCAKGVFRPIFPEHNADLWREHTGGSESYPVTANSIVYIGARNGQLHAFDVSSKAEIWTYQLGGFVNAAPAISDGILYVASGDGNVYAFANAKRGCKPRQRESRAGHSAARYCHR